MVFPLDIIVHSTNASHTCRTFLIAPYHCSTKRHYRLWLGKVSFKSHYSNDSFLPRIICHRVWASARQIDARLLELVTWSLFPSNILLIFIIYTPLPFLSEMYKYKIYDMLYVIQKKF